MRFVLPRVASVLDVPPHFLQLMRAVPATCDRLICGGHNSTCSRHRVCTVTGLSIGN